jgi:hypothetical protein
MSRYRVIIGGFTELFTNNYDEAVKFARRYMWLCPEVHNHHGKMMTVRGCC